MAQRAVKRGHCSGSEVPVSYTHLIDTEKRHLHILSSLQHGLYATEAMAILAATMILTMVVL